MTDELHEIGALQWAYSALAIVISEQIGGRESEWYRRARPTIARMLDAALALDRGNDALRRGSGMPDAVSSYIETCFICEREFVGDEPRRRVSWANENVGGWTLALVHPNHLKLKKAHYG